MGLRGGCNYIEITRAYEADNAEDAPIGKSAGAALAQACVETIRERWARQKTVALVEELTRRGHHIGGGNKVTNLSGALSRSDDLTSSRAKGWGLADWGDSDPAPELPAGAVSAEEHLEKRRPAIASSPLAPYSRNGQLNARPKMGIPQNWS